MTFLEDLVYWLQFGPLRRWFRAFARRCLGKGDRILLGPARDCAFAGAELPYRLGIYEIHVQRVLARVLKRGSVFYDVGANMGFFSLLGARLVGEGGMVIAFEPSNNNGRSLRSLCAANGVQNVQLIDEAISAVDGEARFAQGRNHAQSHLMEVQELGGFTVRTVCLDTFTQTHPFPQVVLMDIEGAELEALRGARNLLSLRNGPTWIVEIHNADNDKLVSELLEGSGYALTPIVPPVPRGGRYPIHLLAEKLHLTRKQGP